MPDLTLYTQERLGAGLTSTNICRVKGAVRFWAVHAGQTWEFPIKDGQFMWPSRSRKTGGSEAGKADLRLQIDGKEIDLAKCKWAVALVISGGAKAAICWIKDRRCSGVEPAADANAARATVEAQCCPEEYRLPPVIT
jgi:hypothetical protein